MLLEETLRAKVQKVTEGWQRPCLARPAAAPPADPRGSSGPARLRKARALTRSKISFPKQHGPCHLSGPGSPDFILDSSFFPKSEVTLRSFKMASKLWEKHADTQHLLEQQRTAGTGHACTGLETSGHSCELLPRCIGTGDRQCSIYNSLNYLCACKMPNVCVYIYIYILFYALDHFEGITRDSSNWKHGTTSCRAHVRAFDKPVWKGKPHRRLLLLLLTYIHVVCITIS